MADYAKITNFATKDTLPSGNSGKIVKGTEIDDEFNAIASAVASKANLGSPAFTGTPTAPTATVGSNTSQIASTAFVKTAVDSWFPTGGIIIWSGAVAAVPTGWYLCDGTNSTPDLRNKFVVGAGSTYAVGATGGSADAVAVSHTHTATSTSTVTDPGHTHGILGSTSTSGGNANTARIGSFLDSGITSSSATTGISVATATTVASAGVSGTNANLPPYYALAYIMKA